MAGRDYVLCGLHNFKKKIIREEEWRVDAMDDGEESENAASPSRLRILAVSILGYTHTEFGKRKMHQITDELTVMIKQKQKTKENVDGLEWLDEEVI